MTRKERLRLLRDAIVLASAVVGSAIGYVTGTNLHWSSTSTALAAVALLIVFSVVNYLSIELQ